MGSCCSLDLTGEPQQACVTTKEDKQPELPAMVPPGINRVASGMIKLRPGNNSSKKQSSMKKKESKFNISAQTFTFKELQNATKNFKQECFLGEGGFGRVYKGRLANTGQVVAVKQLNMNGLQGNREFLVEVLVLSLLNHPNLVKLIGYCADGDQRLLVYEFMPLGSLEDHLHDLPPEKEPLDWNSRMKIAYGAAKGLEYLHDKANPPVICRDFKSSNILLDEEFNPKLSDFGLAKLGPTGDKSHVSTRVMGTYGYCAPEYAMTGQLTVKSDVYSFGVVFLELITGRRAVDSKKGHGEQNLVAWARPMFNDRKKLAKLADPTLQGRYPMRAIYQALYVASLCVQEEAAARLHMADVVSALSYLVNQSYDPNSSPSLGLRSGATQEGKISPGGAQDVKGVGSIADEEGRGSGRKLNVAGKEKEDSSPRDVIAMLTDRDFNRAKAVAEAKMWGENWRDKTRTNGNGSFDTANN